MKIKSKDKAMLPENTNMVHDAIPHFIRVGNCPNSTNTCKDEEGTPTLQVNSKSRPIWSISSGNLAKKMSFKSFQSIQNSCANSHESSNEINDSNPSAHLKTLILHQIPMN